MTYLHITSLQQYTTTTILFCVISKPGLFSPQGKQDLHYFKQHRIIIYMVQVTSFQRTIAEQPKVGHVYQYAFHIQIHVLVFIDEKI